MKAKVERFKEEKPKVNKEFKALISSIKELALQIIQLSPNLPSEAGPPGVGKTSLGKSIAACIWRNAKYTRYCAGCVSVNEQDNEGHRKTYIGAMPGRLYNPLKKPNLKPGDPSSALLEVLNPEQNTAFYDSLNGGMEIRFIEADIEQILGAPIFDKDMYENNDVAGVVTGLAWTSVGGDILFIESSLSPGKGKLSLTGNLGEVMKESASIAMAYLRSHAEGVWDHIIRYIDQWDVNNTCAGSVYSERRPFGWCDNADALTSLFTQKTGQRPNWLMTGGKMTAETTIAWQRILTIIVAIKEAVSNFAQFSAIYENKPERFLLISGDDPATLPMMALGAVGIISVVGNAYPAKVATLSRLCAEGNYADARQIHMNLLGITDLCFIEAIRRVSNTYYSRKVSGRSCNGLPRCTRKCQDSQASSNEMKTF
ncbi:hypothetical protein FQR65_LT17943 [Abscondita terminalis]|nr:hypothetical protein FQR65_LT17943 [Abscondita terminalis]